MEKQSAMENKNRRKFLRDMGLTVGALALGSEIALGFPPFQKQIKPFTRQRPTPKPPPVDYRYAPESWQSTYCFPNDPFKSLVSKTGELLYGHGEAVASPGQTTHIVSFGFHGRAPGTYLTQKIESPGIPVVTTRLDWPDAGVEMTLFASNAPGEGRVDNLLVTVTPKSAAKLTLAPELVVTSKARFSSDTQEDERVTRKETGTGTLEGKPDSRLFFIVDAPVDHSEREGVHRFELKEEELAGGTSAIYFFRFPQESQEAAKIAGGLTHAEDLLAQTRATWQNWKPTPGAPQWNLSGAFHDLFTASARNMSQCRESSNGKGSYLSGPSQSRTLRAVDGPFLIEAALYLGDEAGARETLAALWDRQDPAGAIVAPTGDQHAKDTAAALYALVRHAELTQNWDYFNELYPDAHKAMLYLRSLRDNAVGDGTANGAYSLMQKGPGDDGLTGVRAEFSTTLWTLVGLKHLLEASDRLFLDKRSDTRDFYGRLRAAFIAASRMEMRMHPDGFSYLPMLMKDDELWSDPDPRLRPQPQTAQISLSQALYPGLLFTKDDKLVAGHLQLMKSALKEDVPAGTGWLSAKGVWNGNAAVAAQTFLWAGMPDVAHALFVGFLNHASPLFAWRQEQPLAGSGLLEHFGEMPQSWASAECIRFLRHMLVLEDDKSLRLLDGLAEADLAAGKPIALTQTPTRWGRVSISLEPVDAKTWLTKFSREPAEEKNAGPLSSVLLPLRLPGNFQFDKFTGPGAMKNAPAAIIDPSVLSWEVTWRNFRRS